MEKKKKSEEIRLFLIPAIIFIIATWIVLTLLLDYLVGSIGIIVSSIITVLLILDSFQYVEPIHFGVPLRLGKLIGFLKSGWHITIPLIDKLDKEFEFSLKPNPMDIKFDVITLDNRKVILDSKVRWAPNPNIKESGTNVPRFSSITNKMMEEGLNDKIKSEIGRISGCFYWEIFRSERRGIENYINSILRLEKPIHVNADRLDDMKEYEDLSNYWLDKNFWDKKKTYSKEGELSKNTIEELNTEIPFEKRIHFYSHFSKLIGEILRKQSDLNLFSDEEKYYGVDIHNFTLGTVRFSEETTTALEQEQRTKDSLNAEDLIHLKKMERAKKYKELGVSSQQALNSAEIDSRQSEGQNTSIVGKGIPIILGGGGK